MISLFQRLFLLFRVSVLAIFALSTKGVSQTPTASFVISPDWAQETLIVVPDDMSDTCSTPTRLARIDLARELVPLYFDVSPFLHTEATSKTVGIRRAGKMEQNPVRTQISSRFSKRFYSDGERRNMASLNLRASLVFCDYEGFLEFIRASYTLSGDIGNFTVFHQGLIETDIQDTLSLMYTSRSWTPTNGGQFEPIVGSSFAKSPNDNFVGRLKLTFDWRAIPMELKEGKEPLLVDIRASTHIYVAEDREAP